MEATVVLGFLFVVTALSATDAAPACDISKSGTRICVPGPVTDERVTQSVAPVTPFVMARIIADYGFGVSVVITQDLQSTTNFSGAAPVCDISKSGTRICATGPVTSERVTQSAAPVIPVVMAGIIAIYGLVVAVVITQDMLSTADFSDLMELMSALASRDSEP